MYGPAVPVYLFQSIFYSDNVKNSRIFKRIIMNATDAMFHLDAVARSIPEPVLPPNALNSQISGILRATRPFLDTYRDCILQNIEVLEQQLSVYDALLNRIDEVRFQMQSHRDAVHKSMSAYSSTLAPIRRLPSEIFRTVFREVQISLWYNTEDSESEEELKDYQVLVFSQGPWKLSHVCGAWRDIVLSYPQLWSHIVLQYHWTSHPTETLHHTLSALQAMILRSAQHPLDIVFELEDSDKHDAAVQVFPVILEESYRWRSMVLQIPLVLLEQMKMVREKFPCLGSLTMKTAFIPQYSRVELPEDVRSAFIDAPRLRKVVLDHTHGFGNFMFPHHISHLATYMSNVSNLQAYQSLVQCHFMEYEHSFVIDIPPPIHLPNVRRLFVSSPQLLSYLRLPSLDNLMICPSYASDIDDAISVMNEFVHRSRCSLTSLAIHSCVSFHQVFIEDCLLLMDSLVSLEIGLIRNENAMFDALASIGFLPNLQHLSLLILISREPSLWDQLTAMISSRSRYLRSIRISCSDSDDVERINEHLEPLQLPGLSMIVSLESYTEAISYFGKFQCA
ncbi:hypothetical protein EV421DRAFT_1731207 [Armillaria borealis]|uniref:F-box domain-containing protein n=1 Tax=Armillaria borealis TaxID=47425 RepID=A0AA39K3N7_9AGAR|nr:hypothetical protein EV421DRAFT_1731207 [Armillaria borealis]